MQTVQVQITAEQLLDAIKQLPVSEQRELHKRLGQLAELKKGANGEGHQRKNKSEIEADLLIRIRLNSSLPDAAQRRFTSLRRKLQNETIKKEELKEFQLLTSRLEAMSVERLASVIELAKLRGADFEATWQELELDKTRHVVS